MKKKLTLRMNKEIIEAAKKIAKEREESVSGLTEKYFRNLARRSKEEPENQASAFISRLKGTIQEGDREDYEKYLQEKYS